MNPSQAGNRRNLHSWRVSLNYGHQSPWVTEGQAPACTPQWPCTQGQAPGAVARAAQGPTPTGENPSLKTFLKLLGCASAKPLASSKHLPSDLKPVSQAWIFPIQKDTACAFTTFLPRALTPRPKFSPEHGRPQRRDASHTPRKHPQKEGELWLERQQNVLVRSTPPRAVERLMALGYSDCAWQMWALYAFHSNPQQAREDTGPLLWTVPQDQPGPSQGMIVVSDSSVRLSTARCAKSFLASSPSILPTGPDYYYPHFANQKREVESQGQYLELRSFGHSSQGNCGEGNGNPLQYSCLENPMDRGAWRATVHGVSRVGHDLASKPLPPPVRQLTSRPWPLGGHQVCTANERFSMSGTGGFTSREARILPLLPLPHPRPLPGSRPGPLSSHAHHLPWRWFPAPWKW